MQSAARGTKTLAKVATASLLISSAGIADDTEIYTNNPNSGGVNPNLLFVIDTSNSMNAVETVLEYDPAFNYASIVPPGQTACDSDRIYAWIGGSIPSCNTVYWFEKTYFRCKEGFYNLDINDTGVGSGYYSDRIARYNYQAETWTWLHSNFHLYRNNSNHYECRSDRGYHGVNDTSSRRYITDSSNTANPYSQYYWNEESWNNFGYRTLLNGNYMNYYHYAGVGGTNDKELTRLEIIVNAAKDLVDSVTGINVGLVRFDSTGTLACYNDACYTENTHGGPVVQPIIDISSDANKTTIKNALDAFTAPSSTPLVETTYEAMRYYQGDTVYFGGPRPNGSIASVAAAKSPPTAASTTYDSPIEFSCGQNYMVVFTDGEPTGDAEADTTINSLIDGFDDDSCSHGPNYFAGSDSCLDELAEYMYTADHSPDDPSDKFPGGNTLTDLQNIVSYYIGGFNDADDALLQAAAEKGGSENAFNASNPSEFSAVFAQIVGDILKSNASFTSPAVSVNALNRLRNNNDLYFALFEPSETPHWNGNIKKYKLAKAPGGGDEVIIADRTGQNAITEQGLFATESESYWLLPGKSADGDQTSEGGAANRMFDYNAGSETHDAASRRSKVYTYLTNYLPDSSSFDGNGINLNPIDEGAAFADPAATGELSNKITKTALGMTGSNDNLFFDRIKWLRGVDVYDETGDGTSTDGRPIMGGVLHTEPVIVNYTSTGANTTDPSDDTQTNVIMTTTNDGYFHLFRTEETSTIARTEHSAIIPKAVLDKFDEIVSNAAGSVAHRLDSNIDIWRLDANGDNQIVAADGDRVYAYFGQRRGGRTVFAFDITDPDAPKLLWEINADNIPESNIAADVAPFKLLGQTWSKPKHTQMQVLNSSNVLDRRDVVVFSAGYDVDRGDNAGTPRSSDDFGNAVFIVDALTGEMLWWAYEGSYEVKDSGGATLATLSPDFSDADMQYSFTSDIRTIDINGDGIMDKMFLTDTGGQVWRFDVKNQLSASDPKDLASRISGGVIADLQLADVDDGVSGGGTTSTAENNRRLYYAPDVALIQETETDPVQISVAVGTGYRAHPLDEAIADRLYVMKFDDVLDAPASYSAVKLTPDEMLDVTNINFNTTALEDIPSDDADNLQENGWFIRLTNSSNALTGEKSLSGSVTVDGTVFFTTFTPPDSGSGSAGSQECIGNQGSGKAYVISIFDGAPVENLDGIGGSGVSDLTLSDRAFNLKTPGIPPRPKIVYPDLEGVSGKVIVGRDLLPVDILPRPELTFWIQENAQ